MTPKETLHTVVELFRTGFAPLEDFVCEFVTTDKANQQVAL